MQMRISRPFVLLNPNLAGYGRKNLFLTRLLAQLLSALHVDSHHLCHVIHTTLESGLLSALLVDTWASSFFFMMLHVSKHV